MELAIFGVVGYAAWKLGWLAKLGITLPGAPPPPGGTPPPGGGTMTEDQAALIIWNNDAQIRSLYGANHPDWSPVQSVKDWWTWAPHEGASNLADYVTRKGWR